MHLRRLLCWPILEGLPNILNKLKRIIMPMLGSPIMKFLNFRKKFDYQRYSYTLQLKNLRK